MHLPTNDYTLYDRLILPLRGHHSDCPKFYNELTRLFNKELPTDRGVVKFAISTVSVKSGLVNPLSDEKPYPLEGGAPHDYLILKHYNPNGPSEVVQKAEILNRAGKVSNLFNSNKDAIFRDIASSYYKNTL